MKWITQTGVGTKLTIGFSIMVLFMGAIGYAGYSSSTTIKHNLDDIFGIRLPSLNYLLQADRDLQQLLVAERSMIFANAKSDAFKQLVADYNENFQQAEERWNKYKALPATAEESDLIPKYEKAREAWKAITKRVVDGRTADTRKGRREALDLTLGAAAVKFEEMRDYLDKLTDINLNIAREERDSAAVLYRNTVWVILSVTGFGLMLGIFLSWSIGRGITKPIKRIVDGLNEGAEQVASASGQVSSSSQSLAEGSSEQASSIEETSASLEEMSSMTRQNADNAGQADGLMKEANQMVSTANGSMQELTVSMEEISKASEETSKIIKTIDEIAFQTNLLALNAAVEAARAGEAGAGFAVVADEVRNLAMRAADAAKNTAELIEATVKKVNDGTGLVSTTNDAFGRVAENASKVGELVAEIAAASNEQSQGISQVNTAVTEMDKVVQKNAASAEESASASEEMNAQAEQMKTMVSELVELVEGGGGMRRKASAVKVTETATQPRKVADRQMQVNSSQTGKAVDPAKLIPFGDDDFQDF